MLSSAFSVPGAAPAQAQAVPEEKCSAPDSWIADEATFPAGKVTDEKSECEFYQRSWQGFLHITHMGANGPSLMQDYATFDTLFLKQPQVKVAGRNMMLLQVRTPEEPVPVFDGGINQAFSSAVIDANGNPIFYSIAIDPVFEKFIRDNKLNDVSVVRGPADPAIPDGAIEIKAAWQIVDDPAKFSNYVVVDAMVPALKQESPNKIVVDRSKPARRVKAALLGIHVVFKIDNHPEFVWATFEHIDGNGEFDLGPRAAGIPGTVSGPVSPKDFTLYAAGTTYDQGNKAIRPLTLQPDGRIAGRSSIYRAHPFSQVTFPGSNPLEEDEDIADLNASVKDLFARKAAGDVRRNYKLVGSVWLRNGAADLSAGVDINDDQLLGERGLSNLAIESMTQTTFPHCFSCHQPKASPRIPAKKINVSHLFSMFSDAKP